MNNHYVVGAEQVQHAANSFRDTVEQFKLAVGWLDDSFKQHQRWQEEYLTRLEALMSKQEASNDQ